MPTFRRTCTALGAVLLLAYSLLVPAAGFAPPVPEDPIPPSSKNTCNQTMTEIGGQLSSNCRDDCDTECEWANNSSPDHPPGKFCYCPIGDDVVCCKLVDPGNNQLPYADGACGIWGCPPGNVCVVDCIELTFFGKKIKIYFSKCV